MVRLGIDFQPALVRVSGNDPNNDKTTDRSFYTTVGEQTSLSSSGIHFFQRNTTNNIHSNKATPSTSFGVNSDIVLTVASVLVPFLSPSVASRSSKSSTIRSSWSFPLLERNATVSIGLESNGNTPTWHRAKLVALFDVGPADRVSSILTGNKSSPSRQNSVSFATLAVLQLIDYKRKSDIPMLSQYTNKTMPPRTKNSLERGDAIDIISSPFGLVSPAVFRNTLSTGVVSNVVYSHFNKNRISSSSSSSSSSTSPSNRNITKEPVLLLTDTQIFPGSEGGAVVSHGERHPTLHGIVASPLQRADGTFVELAAVIPANVFLQRLGFDIKSNKSNRSNRSSKSNMRNMSKKNNHNHNHNNHNNRSLSSRMPSIASSMSSSMSSIPSIPTIPPISFPLHFPSPLPSPVSSWPNSTTLHQSIARGTRSLVCIRAGAAWGSGILMSKQGHIITCAHLIKPVLSTTGATTTTSTTSRNNYRLTTRQKISVRVDAEMEHTQARQAKWHSASVLFCSFGALDMACIQLDSKTIPKESLPIEIESDIPYQGASAVVIGHALFDPTSSLSSTVSVGSVAKVTPFLYQPMILQTSASVFRGDSGGMIVSGKTGKLLGMITSNARQADSGIIPKLNFSISSSLLSPTLGTTIGYTQPDEKGGLHEWFDTFEKLSHNQDLHRLWDLENTEEDVLQQLDLIALEEERRQTQDRRRPKL